MNRETLNCYLMFYKLLGKYASLIAVYSKSRTPENRENIREKHNDFMVRLREAADCGAITDGQRSEIQAAIADISRRANNALPGLKLWARN